MSVQAPDPRVGRGGLTDEGGATIGLHVGGDAALAKDCGEIGLGDVINLLDARSAKVDTVERAGLAGGDGGNNLKYLAKS